MEPTTYRIPLNLIDEARARIEKANRRLARAGVGSTFTWYEENVTVENAEGNTVAAVDLTLSSPSLSFEGWEFIASVHIMETGTILYTPTHVNADDLPRPDSHRCDHCGKIRSRKYSYLLRNEDGEIKQVGKSCLALFLGVSPQGLWALQWADLLDDLAPEMGSSAWGSAPILYPVDEVVRISMIATNNGRDYISRDRALDNGKTSTADIVRDVLNRDRNLPREEREKMAELHRRAMLIDDAEVATVIECVKDIDGEYGENLRVVMGEENIISKHVGLAASVTSAYHRQVEKNERDKVKKKVSDSLVQGYLAEPGEKITNVPVTITKVIGGFDDGYGGVKCLLLAVDDKGHLIKWFGSVPDDVDGVEVDAGARFNVVRATVKSNEIYQGDYQTVVNRVKFAIIED